MILSVGPPSQTPKDEGILGLKRPYDIMEGGISRGLPLRDSLSAANLEGKTCVMLTKGYWMTFVSMFNPI